MKKKIKYIIIALIILWAIFKIFTVAVKYNMNSENITIEMNSGSVIYVAESEFSGEYDMQRKIIQDESHNYKEYADYLEMNQKYKYKELNTVMSYKEYADYCKSLEMNQKYNCKFLDYIVITRVSKKGYKNDIKLAAVNSQLPIFNSANVYICYEISDYSEEIEPEFCLIVIPVNKYIRLVDMKSPVYTREVYEKIKHSDLSYAILTK